MPEKITRKTLDWADAEVFAHAGPLHGNLGRAWSRVTG
jgi:hypothetical protein